MNELLQLVPLIALIGAMLLALQLYSPASRFGSAAKVCFRILAVALWPVALISAGNFSLRQGIVLGLMLGWLSYETGKALNKSTRRLTPYRVWVAPRWEGILLDFKLINSSEEWSSISESVRSSGRFSILRDGITFTVVQQGWDSATKLPKRDRDHHAGWQEVGDFDAGINEEHPPLIFWNQQDAFGTKFRFSEDMAPIQFEPVKPWQGHSAFFFMALHCEYAENPRGKKYRPGVLGSFDLGLSVPKFWWERVKDSCPAPLRVDSKPDSASVSITLAALPLSEFYIYRIPERERDEYRSEAEPYLRRRREENRAKLGWTNRNGN
jgi:hypothetical protein